MSFQKVLKAVCSVLPAPIMAFVGEWQAIYDGTIIVRSGSNEAIGLTAVAIGTLLVLSLTIFLFNAPTKRLALLSVLTFGGIVLLLVGIAVIRFFLDGRVGWETAILLFFPYDLAQFLIKVLTIALVALVVLASFNLFDPDASE